jgi:predicted phosphoribosyltransferase
MLGISQPVIEIVAGREILELERREEAYRGGREGPSVAGRCLIVIDDGLATGSSMRAAVRALRTRQPSRIVVAVPVAARETRDDFEHEVDEVICAHTPDAFNAVGQWYDDFSQTSDDEVRELYGRARRRHDRVAG